MTPLPPYSMRIQVLVLELNSKWVAGSVTLDQQYALVKCILHMYKLMALNCYSPASDVSMLV